MQNLRPDPVSKNIGYLLSSEIITKILSLCSFVLMAKGLSLEGYGVIALAFSIGSMFYTLFNLGLDYHLIRDIKKRCFKLEEIFSTVTSIKIWALPIFIFIFLIVYYLMKWELSYFKIIFFIFLHFYLFSSITILFFFFRAHEKMKYEFITRLIHGIALFACAFLFGYMQKNLFLLGLSYLCVSLITFFSFFKFFNKKYGFSFQFNPLILKKQLAMIGESKYLFLNQICTSIFSSVDILIISFVLGLNAVAIYKNAILITVSLFMFPTIVIQGFYPRLVQYNFESSSFWLAIKKILKKTITFGIIIGTILFCLAPWIITSLFSEKYAASVPLFRISLLSFLFACVDSVFGYGIIATGEYKLLFTITFAVSVFSLLLNLVLISSIGLIGGVITSNLTHFLLIILLLLAFGYRRKYGEVVHAV